MRYCALILTFFLLSSTVVAQKGWVQQRQEGEDILYSIDLFDADNITAVGLDGIVLRSTDAGATWTRNNIGTTEALRRVRWHTPTLGLILGNGGVAYKSVDGGASWTAINTGTGSALFDVHFFDENNWIVVGKAGRTLVTTDGGTSFEDKGSGTNNYNEIDFHGDFGVIVGNAGTIRWTRDGGERWNKGNSPVSLELLSVSCGDDSTAVISGINGTILRSTDYGRNWEQVWASIPISQFRMSGVRHLTRDRAVIAGYGGIVLESLDAGVTWTPQESNTQVNLEALSFIDSKIGVSAGWNGTVMRTSSGGTLSVTRDAHASPRDMRLSAFYPNPVSRSATTSAAVRVDIVKQGQAKLRVYDLLGREQAVLLSRSMDPGSYTITWNPSALAKGVYLYRLSSAGSAQTRKFTVVD